MQQIKGSKQDIEEAINIMDLIMANPKHVVEIQKIM